MRENLHCWRAGATATPLSSSNHSSLPRPTLFVIASCASCVTTACSIDVKARNIILTFHVARRRADRTPSFAKNKACRKSEEPRHSRAQVMDRPFRARGLHPSLSARRSDIEGSRSAILPPPVTTLFLSIDRSGLTHPVSRVSSSKLINLSIGRITQESCHAFSGQGRDRHRRQFRHRQGSAGQICRCRWV